MKYLQCILLISVALAFIALASADYGSTSLGYLQKLSDNGIPTSEFDVYEGVSANDDRIYNDDSMSFLDQSSNPHETVQAFPAIKALGSLTAAAADPRALEFSKIQYLQAAIAEKKESVIRQRLTVLQEEAEIKRETKLMRMNKKIIAQNEEQINEAQDTLAAMVKRYGETLKLNFNAAVEADKSRFAPLEKKRLLNGTHVDQVNNIQQGDNVMPVEQVKEAEAPKKAKKTKKTKKSKKAEKTKKSKKAKKTSFIESEIDMNLSATQDSIDSFLALADSDLA